MAHCDTCGTHVRQRVECVECAEARHAAEPKCGICNITLLFSDSIDNGTCNICARGYTPLFEHVFDPPICPNGHAKAWFNTACQSYICYECGKLLVHYGGQIRRRNWN